MCTINCSGGCKECAPDEHAASAAQEWLEENGYTLTYEGWCAVATTIAKNMKEKK